MDPVCKNLLEHLGIDMVRICAGTFIMGSDPSERKSDERQHKVTISRDFYLSKTEVTREQWMRVVAELVICNPANSRYKTLQRYCGEGAADHPVTDVSWNDVIDFCNAMSEKWGIKPCYSKSWLFSRQKCNFKRDGFRLPTEAEWEYAARAGYSGSHYKGRLDDIASRGLFVSPVGQKQPNDWGIYDTLGSVHEWVWDSYDYYPEKEVQDPTGPTFGSKYRKVYRGMSFGGKDEHFRLPRRGYDSFSHSSDLIGFRLARSVRASNREGFSRLSSTERCLGGKALVEIKPGTFIMGSPATEAGRESGETEHQVTITKAFLLGKTEVTQSLWLAVMGSNPSNFRNCGADCPVEQVSWYDVVEFCNKLSKREGLRPCYSGSGEALSWDRSCTGYRLPTEAEWEYAARAGTTGASYGDLDEVAWYRENSNSSTNPVGFKQANAWGLHDMLGNVNEWVWDWEDDYPAGSVSDPTGPASGWRRVCRGGNWANIAIGCRAASRSSMEPDYLTDDQLGFRLARSL